MDSDTSYLKSKLSCSPQQPLERVRKYVWSDSLWVQNEISILRDLISVCVMRSSTFAWFHVPLRDLLHRDLLRFIQPNVWYRLPFLNHVNGDFHFSARRKLNVIFISLIICHLKSSWYFPLSFRPPPSALLNISNDASPDAIFRVFPSSHFCDDPRSYDLSHSEFPFFFRWREIVEC